MKKKVSKIAFIGLYEDDNLGDPVIAKCTESLYLKYIPHDDRLLIKHLSLNHFIYNAPNGWLRYYWICKNRLNFSWKKIEDWCIEREYISYFCNELKDVDAIIVVGGGLLEFTGGRFVNGLYACTIAGNKYKIPVMITATGIEGFDRKNPLCKKIKKMLHQQSLKYISTRDDIDTLVHNYFDNRTCIKCEKVCDPAVWSSEVFNIKKSENSDIIGIGVVRKNIFVNYGIDFSEMQLAALYVGIIKYIIKLELKVQLFTNGTIADNIFAFEIISLLQKEGINLSYNIPNSPDELLKIISNYKGVIAGRLHSCIISYSLNIPAVGLVWNEKLKLFGQSIGEEDNFIEHDKFIPQLIVDQLQKAMKKGYNQECRNKYRNTILESIKECVNSIILEN